VVLTDEGLKGAGKSQERVTKKSETMPARTLAWSKIEPGLEGWKLGRVYAITDMDVLIMDH
jgi:hypothetical protein